MQQYPHLRATVGAASIYLSAFHLGSAERLQSSGETALCCKAIPEAFSHVHELFLHYSSNYPKGAAPYCAALSGPPPAVLLAETEGERIVPPMLVSLWLVQVPEKDWIQATTQGIISKKLNGVHPLPQPVCHAAYPLLSYPLPSSPRHTGGKLSPSSISFSLPPCHLTLAVISFHPHTPPRRERWYAVLPCHQVAGVPAGTLKVECH